MRRRSRAGGEPPKTRRRKTVKRRNAAKTLVRRSSSAVSQEAKVSLLTRERDEALEQLSAASEVLSIISSSPGDVAPVFQAMLENAVRICESKFGILYRYDNDRFVPTAGFGLPSQLAKFIEQRGPFRPGVGTNLDRLLKTKDVVSIADDSAESAPGAAARFGNARSLVTVPMLKDDVLIGAIILWRLEVRPFTEKQIALLTNFATQAVIAVENTRLLNELHQRTDDLGEALQQQTATAEVLKVIARTQGELQPVFETMLAKATELCGASYGALWLRVDDGFRYAALHGDLPQIWTDHLRNGTVIRVRPDVPLARLMQTLRPVPIPDMRTDPSYLNGDPLPVSGVDIGGIRTLVLVPMIKNNDLVGAIAIYRKEVRPFAEKQIELLSNFAAQAVIAIENTRLLNELRQRTDDLTESLEQQTVTSEVLRVISSSPEELKPVFKAILENATRICEASFGSLLLLEGDTFRRVAFHNTPAKYAEFSDKNPLIHHRQARSLDRLIETKQAVHVTDMAVEDPDVPITRFGNARTLLVVPMLKENELVGAIGIYRQEVRPFTDKQIALLQNFAAQAVIAIENTRLLNELRQSLEQQTATSEVLRVISSSPGELEPVFQAMLENATRICEAKFGILYRFDGEAFHFAAEVGTPPEYAEFGRRRGPFQPTPGRPLDHVMRTKRLSQTADAAADAVIGPGPTARLGGARSMVAVPMPKDEVLMGAIVIYRQEVRPFTDKQIALVKNFAAQAVIAIENTRLLNELRESLEQQTATSEVLKVISSSPGELKPVFDTILENATRICEAKFGILCGYDGNLFKYAAVWNAPPAFLEFILQRGSFAPRAGTPLDRILKTKHIIHRADASVDEVLIDTARLAGAKSHLTVPMFKDEALVGAIILSTVRKYNHSVKSRLRWCRTSPIKP